MGYPKHFRVCIYSFRAHPWRKKLPVKTLVLPNLGPDVMLIDNSIMEAFAVKLHWAAERRLFKDSNTTIPTIHTKAY